MRKESDQAARALSEQSRAMRDVLSGTQNIAKQLNLISTANVQHSTGASRVLGRLGDVHTAVRRAGRSAHSARGSNGRA
jgi:hypothetical protein